MKKKGFICVDIGISALQCAIASYDAKVRERFSLPLASTVPTIIERSVSCSLALEEAILKAETDYGVSLKHFYAIIPPLYLSSQQKEFFLNLSPGYNPVTITDLHRIKLHELAAAGTFSWDYQLICVYPLLYYTDDGVHSEFPLRRKTKKIGLKAELIFVRKHFYNAFEHLNAFWGVEFAGLVPFFVGMEQYVAGKKYFQGERVFLVHLGPRSASLACYQQGRLAGFQQIFCGIENVDRLVCETFGISPSMVEEIKPGYGRLRIDESLKTKDIHLKTEDGYRKINSFEFVGVLREGYRRLITDLLPHLDNLSAADVMVFFGPAVSLEGFEAFLKESFPQFAHVPVFLVDDAYAAVSGCAAYICKEKSGESKIHTPFFRLQELMREYFSA